MSDLDKLARDAQLDQTESGYEAIARVAGTYHRGLIVSGVPGYLADVLVRDWHWLFQHQAICDCPPEVMPGE